MESSGVDHPPIALEEGVELREQYRITGVLGAGSFGITYLAHDQHLDTTVAIKEYFPRRMASRGDDGRSVRPKSGGDREDFRFGRSRFLKEGRLLASFDHPNVVRVRSYFETHDTGYLVMDYYEGQTLADRLAAAGGKLDEETAVSIIDSVLAGLETVHADGVLHRDIDPQNVYLPEEGESLLLDFGAARVAVGEKTKSLSVILKPGYAPFEQYHSGGDQGPWTDVYACAATLYRCLMGEAPPSATKRIESEAPLPLEEAAGSPSIRRALEQGLQLWPEDRPQTAAAFRELLSRESETSTEAGAVPTEQPDPRSPTDVRTETAQAEEYEEAGESVWERVRSHPVVSGLVLAGVVLIGFVGSYVVGVEWQNDTDPSRPSSVEAGQRSFEDTGVNRTSYGLELLEADNRETALQQFTLAVQENPNDVRARYELGKLYLENAEAHTDSADRHEALASSITHLEAAVKSGPPEDLRVDACEKLSRAYRLAGPPSRLCKVERGGVKTDSAGTQRAGRKLLKQARDALGGGVFDRIENMAILKTQDGEKSMLFIELPDKMRLERGRMTIVDDGQTMKMARGDKARDLPTSMADQFASGLWQHLPYLMANLDREDLFVRSKADTTIGGTPYKAVQVRPPAGDDYTLYLNSRTMRPERLTGETTMKGTAITVMKKFSDYREVEGILVPHTTETTHSIRKDGKGKTRKTTENIQSLKVNTDLSESLFTIGESSSQ